LYSNKTEQKSGLSRHYRQIGIKAVAAATRKETAPHLEQAARRHKKEDIMSEASRIVESLDKTQETSAETIQGVQEGLTSALENVRDLNVKLIDMARANTDAAFDFAREAAEAKAPSDLVQAWTTHATKQFDMLTKQASDLTTLGQQFASTSSEPIKRRVGQASKGQKV
jgi:hypothetical protein